MNAPLPGPLGPPPDLPAAIATALGALFLWQGRAGFTALFRAHKALAVALIAAVALLSSAGYVHHYLRGGPRIIDATSYWLEARALAEGHVTWPIAEPTASVRGRFLLEHDAIDAPRVGVIFPPGYPVALALGFLIGSPLFVGPLTAALLAVATYWLAKSLVERHDVALLAACLSALSATLRYHTADTMSHGWAALLFTASLAFVYRAARAGGGPQAAPSHGGGGPEAAPSHGGLAASRSDLVPAALAGIAFGWFFATRPVSALALLPVFAYSVLELRAPARATALFASLVPVGLFVLEQRALTGSFFRSSQTAYYALSDGPPDCFRYGFGSGIGCLHEHGAYVASVLPHGLTAAAAAVTTLRRLRLHLIDVANFEPFALLAMAAPFVAMRARGASASGVRPRRIAALAIGVLSIVLAYAPFYFDGSYPGGGARLFVEVLPAEHALIAVAIALALEAVRARPAFDFARASAWACAASLAGFGVHAAYEHVRLRDREGGRPFFEPDVLAKAKIETGLLFVGTDHAFNLAHDPAARDASRALVVAREFGDDRDRLTWERLGRPPAHRYVFDGRDDSKPAVVPWAPGPDPHPYRFEAEAEWPPIWQSGGHFEPVFAQGTCAWGGRMLAVRTSPDRPFNGTISFPVPFRGRFRVGVHVAARGEVVSRFVLRQDGEGPPLATWGFAPPKRELMCSTLAEEEVNLAGRAFVEVAAKGSGDLFIDAVALEPATPTEYAR